MHVHEGLLLLVSVLLWTMRGLTARYRSDRLDHPVEMSPRDILVFIVHRSKPKNNPPHPPLSLHLGHSSIIQGPLGP